MGILKKPVMFSPAYMILTDIENHPIYVNPLCVTAIATDGKGVTRIIADGVKADGGAVMKDGEILLSSSVQTVCDEYDRCYRRIIRDLGMVSGQSGMYTQK